MKLLIVIFLVYTAKKSEPTAIVLSAGQSLAYSTLKNCQNYYLNLITVYHVIEFSELFSVSYHLKEILFKLMLFHLVKVSLRYLY